MCCFVVVFGVVVVVKKANVGGRTAVVEKWDVWRGWWRRVGAMVLVRSEEVCKDTSNLLLVVVEIDLLALLLLMLLLLL